jgi:sarcosine oxidase delta subunit
MMAALFASISLHASDKIIIASVWDHQVGCERYLRGAQRPDVQCIIQ